MTKILASITAIMLTGCQMYVPTQEQFYSQMCEDIGYEKGSEKHADCFRQQMMAVIEARKSDNIRQQKWMHADDKEKCNLLGYKKGNNFARCMAQLEDFREQEKNLQLLALRTEERKQANLQSYYLRQQALQREQYRQNTNQYIDAITANTPQKLHCSGNGYEMDCKSGIPTDGASIYKNVYIPY